MISNDHIDVWTYISKQIIEIIHTFFHCCHVNFDTFLAASSYRKSDCPVFRIEDDHDVLYV